MQCHGSDYLLYLSRSWKAEWLSGHYGIRPPHSAQCSVLLHYYPTSLLHTSRRITTNVHFHESLSKLNWLITRTKTKVLRSLSPELRSLYCVHKEAKNQNKEESKSIPVKSKIQHCHFKLQHNQLDYKKRPNTSIIYIRISHCAFIFSRGIKQSSMNSELSLTD